MARPRSWRHAGHWSWSGRSAGGNGIQGGTGTTAVDWATLHVCASRFTWRLRSGSFRSPDERSWIYRFGRSTPGSWQSCRGVGVGAVDDTCGPMAAEQVPKRCRRGGGSAPPDPSTLLSSPARGEPPGTRRDALVRPSMTSGRLLRRRRGERRVVMGRRHSCRPPSFLWEGHRYRPACIS